MSCPARLSGWVERSVPSARLGSGVVKISSVGMLATYSIPDAVSKRALAQLCGREQPDREVRPRPR